ncbi:hypothetical protein MBM_09734 [Drepanopeziza brunnea f. sp. 'multigermtubi' MB_m1]|uniref:Uncharacterized protein n=1 Tax=Marssonina brunnea f. sp. multigermtubi (strain MB_m1) TaxID=1072389 RepID=K1WIV2_MARBU|nr:uncharacterized protein MBM_09734 [Drepanopeziza brunnea f. sp. 'multigermtubi' MB_m1]EKD12097.1 hypothetical protein MBM_09734 [Drepanopeziza brunnea f. sp. 'multigermtubi' MB_m1]
MGSRVGGNGLRAPDSRIFPAGGGATSLAWWRSQHARMRSLSAEISTRNGGFALDEIALHTRHGCCEFWMGGPLLAAAISHELIDLSPAVEARSCTPKSWVHAVKFSPLTDCPRTRLKALALCCPIHHLPSAAAGLLTLPVDIDSSLGRGVVFSSVGVGERGVGRKSNLCLSSKRNQGPEVSNEYDKRAQEKRREQKFYLPSPCIEQEIEIDRKHLAVVLLCYHFVTWKKCEDAGRNFNDNAVLGEEGDEDAEALQVELASPWLFRRWDGLSKAGDEEDREYRINKSTHVTFWSSAPSSIIPDSVLDCRYRRQDLEYGSMLSKDVDYEPVAKYLPVEGQSSSRLILHAIRRSSLRESVSLQRLVPASETRYARNICLLSACYDARPGEAAGSSSEEDSRYNQSGFWIQSLRDSLHNLDRKKKKKVLLSTTVEGSGILKESIAQIST